MTTSGTVLPFLSIACKMTFFEYAEFVPSGKFTFATTLTIFLIDFRPPVMLVAWLLNIGVPAAYPLEICPVS